MTGSSKKIQSIMDKEIQKAAENISKKINRHVKIDAHIFSKPIKTKKKPK